MLLRLERFLERLFYDRIRGGIVAMGALLAFLGLAWLLCPGEVRLTGNPGGAEVLVDGRPVREGRATVWPAGRVAVTVRRAGSPDVVLERSVAPLSRCTVTIGAPPPAAPATPRDTLWESRDASGCDGLLVCDADGDRFPDLLCSFPNPPRMEALSGRDGRALWKRTIDGPATVLVADLDGDCEADVASAGGGRLVVSDLATGRASRSREIPALGRAMMATDVDGDGTADLVVSTAEEVIAFRGTDLSEAWSRPGGSWKRLCRGGPGRIVAWGNGRLAMIDARDGRSVWQASGIGGLEPLAVDVDRDGTADVVASLDGGAIGALSGRDGGVLWRGPADDFAPGTAAAGDLDGDGRPEIVVAGRGGVRILLAGSGRLAGAGADTPGLGPSAPLLANLDGDPFPEILVAGTYGLVALRMDGRDYRGYPIGAGTARPVIADFDGDGRIDVAATSSDRGLCVIPAQSSGAAGGPVWAGPQVCDAAEAAELGRDEARRVRIVDAWAAGWPGRALAAALEGTTARDAAAAFLAARALGDPEAVRRAAADARARGVRRLEMALAEAAAAPGDSGLPALVAALESLPARCLLVNGPSTDREAALCRAAGTRAFARCRAGGRFERSVLVFAPACAWTRTHPGAFAADPWDAAAAAADLAPAPEAARARLALARIADRLSRPDEVSVLLGKTAAEARRLAHEGDLPGARSVAREAQDLASPDDLRGKLGELLRGVLAAGDPPK